MEQSKTLAVFVIAGMLAAVSGLVSSCRFRNPSDADTAKSTPAAPVGKPRPLTDLAFERTPARRDRGKYLVEGILTCWECHSERNDKFPGVPPVPGTEGGGSVFEENPLVVAPNISPDLETGAGSWTDDMLVRSITEGIGHDDRRLVTMPYWNYRNLSEEDLASVVVYLRSLPPVHNPRAKTSLTEEEITERRAKPLPQVALDSGANEQVRRGAYFAKLRCISCHTERDRSGQPKVGLLAGGGDEVASANLTPDESGIPYYDEALFLQALHTGMVKVRELSPDMLWVFFRRMKDEDLKAIFAYLRTIPPVKHRVDNTEPPSYCQLCGGKHGYGDRN